MTQAEIVAVGNALGVRPNPFTMPNARHRGNGSDRSFWVFPDGSCLKWENDRKGYIIWEGEIPPTDESS